MTLDQMAQQLGRTENAVRLYIHRERLQYRPALKNNLVVEMLKYKFTDPRYFRPNRAFYKATGISQIRFWKLYRGEEPISEKEYNALLNHFRIDKHDMFERRQLKLF